jgi:hypothetical protein
VFVAARTSRIVAVVCGRTVVPNERQLCEVSSESARTVVAYFSIEGVVDHLVERVAEFMPVEAGVTLISAGVARAVWPRRATRRCGRRAWGAIWVRGLPGGRANR